MDIDRQRILPFGNTKDVEKHIRKAVRALWSPHGGLMITAGIYPPAPLANIEALCQTLEELGGGAKILNVKIPMRGHVSCGCREQPTQVKEKDK